MNINISSEERNLLLAHPETEMQTRQILDEEEQELGGSADQLDELRNACSDLLLRIGFDEEYRVTSDGALLEELIDKLLT